MLKQKTLDEVNRGFLFAGPTRLELATSSVTDWRSNQAELRPLCRGPKEIRTPDLLNAIQALSQLSYGPIFFFQIAKIQNTKLITLNEISKSFIEFVFILIFHFFVFLFFVNI